jgi:hypothetical protein
MPKLFLLFSHALSAQQQADARQTLGIEKFVALPEELQPLWSDVPPELESIVDHVRPVLEWLGARARPGDYVLAQGDFGAVYLAVTYAEQHGFIPVYATTKRQAIETPQPDGTVQVQRTFRHVRFRTYSNPSSIKTT